MWEQWLATRLFNAARYKPKGTKGAPDYNPKGDRASDLYANIVRHPGGRNINMTYTSLRGIDAVNVADHLVGMAIERLTADGYTDRALIMAEEAWGYHQGRGPRLARAYAQLLHASNDRTHAITVCEQSLASDECPSGPARRLLNGTRQLLAVEQARIDVGSQAAPSSSARSRTSPRRQARRLFE